MIASQYNGGVNISCQGLYNGSIDAIFLGGTPGYTYQWSNGATSEDINGLAAGTYSVTVTDANGCTKVDAITLIEPDAIVLNLTPFTYTGDWHISCYGFNNGSIDLQVTGGSSSYSFNWSNGFISQNISNLTAGSYAVVVTDLNGCTNSASVTLNQPSFFLSATVNDVYIVMAYNGSIDLTVTGGQANGSYNWSTEEISDVFLIRPQIIR
ncbi:MAG: SprB repeat-containing protein [Chitinophagales bacterium]|nr:SprB repeat-containing protein [Chitinophagales bacterium]